MMEIWFPHPFVYRNEFSVGRPRWCACIPNLALSSYQSAHILAVGTGEERAIVRNGKIEAAMMMSVTLSCDHRAVDGALGAELLSAFRRYIENPMSMLV